MELSHEAALVARDKEFEARVRASETLAVESEARAKERERAHALDLTQTMQLLEVIYLSDTSSHTYNVLPNTSSTPYSSFRRRRVNKFKYSQNSGARVNTN